LNLWEIFPYNEAMDASPSNQAPQDSVLPEALAMVQPLVTWLIRSGVGYNEFAAALKPVFLAQAKEELARGQGKATDSAISLLSGLHRKDVRAFRESAKATQKQVQADGTAWGKPSPANQVITRWLSLSDAPECLPFSGPVASFEQLAASVSKDFHPRALLDEMLRLGLVREDEQGVHLLRDAFVPSADLKEARQLMAGSVSDHLQAAVHNLTGPGEHKFLEQSFCRWLECRVRARLEPAGQHVVVTSFATNGGGSHPLVQPGRADGATPPLSFGVVQLCRA
jgi:hypothetical protein